MSFVHKTRFAKQIAQTLAHSKCPLHQKWLFFFLCVHLKVTLKFDPMTLTPIHIQEASSRQAASNPSLIPPTPFTYGETKASKSLATLFCVGGDPGNRKPNLRGQEEAFRF